MRPIQVTHLVLSVLAFSEQCWAQTGTSTTAAATTTKSKLEQLEDLGLSLLSSLVSPTASSTSTFSTPSTSATAAATTTSSPSLAAVKPFSSPTVSTIDSAPSATASAEPEHSSKSHKNLIAIIGAVLGALILLLIAILIWQCCARRKRKSYGRGGPTPLDDDEFESWRQSAPNHTSMAAAYHHRPNTITSQRYYNIPAHPIPSPTPQQHFRSSSKASLVEENPFDDNMYAYNEQQTRQSNEMRMPAAYSANPGRSYNEQQPRRSSDIMARSHSTSPNRGFNDQQARRSSDVLPTNQSPSTNSSTSLQKRVSTPMFGTGRAAGEKPGGVPWVPPRSPHRRSLPMSPLANEFDFGFQEQPDRERRRSIMRHSSSSGTLHDAHSRF